MSADTLLEEATAHLIKLYGFTRQEALNILKDALEIKRKGTILKGGN